MSLVHMDQAMPTPRTCLELGRYQRLPTVWSNCLAGWWLGGAAHFGALPVLFASATCIYLGGALLNDALDAGFDRQHRRARPIPAGQARERVVRQFGLGFLLAGVLLSVWQAKLSGALSLALVLLVVLYDATHRWFTLSPVLKGLCRFMVYLLGASMAGRGVTGWAIWCGVAMACYMTGAGYLARWQQTPHLIHPWPVFLLGAPVFFALVMNVDGYRRAGLLLCAVFLLWLALCLRPAFWTRERHLERTIPGLSAGIVLVDWLAVGPVPPPWSPELSAPRPLSLTMLALFGLTLLLQRLTPER